ncbi:uncharacterized protein J5F26_008039 [Ciconia maguari]
MKAPGRRCLRGGGAGSGAGGAAVSPQRWLQWYIVHRSRKHEASPLLLLFLSPAPLPQAPSPKKKKKKEKKNPGHTHKAAAVRAEQLSTPPPPPAALLLASLQAALPSRRGRGGGRQQQQQQQQKPPSEFVNPSFFFPPPLGVRALPSPRKGEGEPGRGKYHLKEKKEAGPKLLISPEFVAATGVHRQREQEHLSSRFETLRIRKRSVQSQMLCLPSRPLQTGLSFWVSSSAPFDRNTAAFTCKAEARLRGRDVPVVNSQGLERDKWLRLPFTKITPFKAF